MLFPQLGTEKIGNWTILGYARKEGYKHFFKCRCVCGKEKDLYYHRLRRRETNQCQSCNSREINTSHGMCYTTTYKIWRKMKERCDRPLEDNYKYYGGRGITYCERWKSFEGFMQDMGERPEGYQLDRIDNNGNYEPGNCRWVTPSENSRNRRKKGSC